MTPEELTELGRRADELRAQVARADEPTRRLLQDTLDAVTAFHRAGLVTLVRRLRADPRGNELLMSAVAEPEVLALLVGHGIIRADLTLDVMRAVEQLRPHLVMNGSDIEVVEVQDAAVRVRYGGSGCHAPSDDLRAEVRATLLARVPGLREVHEVPAEPEAPFIPLGKLRVGAG